ncbi:MAG: FAD-binding protein [Chloroflexi bacterium]|nr:FAD-binding protein [Chloroflexota bacterium]
MDVDTDVLIVGAGGAGLAAALEATVNGARVLVVDAASEAGGTARTAGGGTFVAGSPLQARLGIDDSPDLALEDWLRWGGDSVDVEWARRYVEGSVPDLYDWLATLGVDWYDVHIQEGNRVPRWHEPRGGGLAVTTALEQAARAEPLIAWSLDTRVTDLVMEAGRVTGIVAEGPNGLVELRAGAVLLASGGFCNSLDMLRQNAGGSLPVDARILLGGGYGARGEGHSLLARVGAQFVNLDVVWMYPYATPDYLDEASARGLVCRGLKGEIWVNQQGVRFHNENLRGGATGTPALLRQSPPTCWTIVDARIADGYSVAHPRYRLGRAPYRDRLQQLLDGSPYVARGHTIDDLARAAGLDAGALRETVAGHNRLLALGAEQDPDFGRDLRGLEPLTEPPFYAIQFFPITRKNLGGVRTDLATRVLDQEDRPIPGLYAAGEVAGMAGGHVNGRAALEGTMFGPSVFSGRIAGKAMAA